MNAKKTAISIAWTFVKIAVLVAIVVAVYRLSFMAYDYGYRIFAEEAIDRPPGRTVTVTIVEGKSVKEIGEILKSKGLINDAFMFRLQEMFSEYKGDLKPGVYELSTAMTPFEMMQIMSAEPKELFEPEMDDIHMPEDSLDLEDDEEDGDSDTADTGEEDQEDQAGETGDNG